MNGIEGTGLSGVKALVETMVSPVHRRPSNLSWPTLVKPAVLVGKLVV
jgi:hypothetical protein